MIWHTTEVYIECAECREKGSKSSLWEIKKGIKKVIIFYLDAEKKKTFLHGDEEEVSQLKYNNNK